MADQSSDATGPKQATPSTSEQSLTPLEVRAQRAWQSVDEEAEEARRLVLGARSRLRPPRMSPAVAEDRSSDAGEVGDILRRLAYDVEEETQRLRDEAASLRSEAARAATALHEALQHTNEAMAEQSAEELDREVGPTVAEAVAGLTEQLARLETVTTTLIGAVQRLEPVGPAVDRLTAIAAKPPPEPVTGPLAAVLGELSQQLSAVSGAIKEQVQGAVEQALIADARRRDASMAQALGRLTDEFVRLRRRLRPAVPPAAAKGPVTKQAATKQAATKQPATKKAAKKKAPPPDAG